ncbi:MAG TPA: Ig-like domain repeat protein, partial [Vicinamibacterales bacterium]|nr:Ig-like domain repeat protein [Vicinamibacterales bacterium]
SSLNPSVAGQAVTFTAAVAVVAPGIGIPAGTVTFMDGAAALGSAALDAAGKATLTTAALAAGGHSITAVYAGAGVFAGSTSAVLTQTVGAAGPAATKTVVTSSNATSLFGVPITLTATVSPIAPATGIVAGTVTFKDGTVVLGTATLSAGAAAFTTSTLAVGTHAITAAFGGSATFAASTSAALSQVIQPSATLKVNFKVHAILDATTKPKVQDIAVPNALVRVYSSGDSCAFNLKVSTQPKRWGIVFDGIDGPLPLDPGCPVVTVGSYRAEATTDVNGNATIIVPPTAATQDWIVIGRTTNFDYIKTVLLSPDPLYSEDEVLNIAAGQTAAVMLNQIAPFAGGILPAKRIVEFGTELDIVEPDDYDWTDDTAQYPFVLVANGAWDVSTNIAPPSGFVPDVPTLAASVADTTSAIQFTLTDVGSDWTQTNVTHVINHKGTTRIRTDAIRMFNKKRTKAKPDFMTVDPGSAGNVFNVLANDNVAPPKTLTITAVTAAANGTVTIGPGAQTVVYTPNAGFSGRDQFTYTIDDGQGAVDIGTVSVRVSLKPSLVVADTSAAEGNSGTSPLSFTVTLSSAVDVPVMVDYATADGSALAGTDYAYASGTLVFAPGETVKTATVSLIGNTVFQTNRTFALQLSNAENAKIFGGVGKATIVDDDPKPVISISANSVVEGNAGITPVTVTLTLTGSTAVPASADYATADGTAAAGTDYTAASGTVTFAPGETVKTFVVSVLGDVTPEATEAFTVNIVNTTAATGGIKTATVSIIDDDSTAWVNTSVADFKAGTVDAGGYISQTNNGEVILAPTLASEFKGKTLDAGWTSTALVAGGASTLGTGGVTIDGAALVGGTTTFAAGRSVEFSAKFSGAAGQNAGFTATGALTAPYAVFGTKAANTLLARSVIAGNTQEIAIAGFTFNQTHKFRIDWNATTVAYWVDDKKVATHTITLSQAMRPTVLDATVGDGALFVEYIRMTPYAAAGTYTSGVFDAGAVVTWMTMSWTANLPTGTSVGLKYRTGNTPTPDATWTALTAVNASGAALAGSTRYLQFVVQESTTDKSQTAVLKDVTLAFKR